jgi:hypothetical protein
MLSREIGSMTEGFVRRRNKAGRLCLSNTEIIEEVEAILLSFDWKRLYWAAYRRLYWARRSERTSLATDLQQEAVVRILGTRPVPTEVAVIAALYQAVRSVAGCWRRKQRLFESIETASTRSTGTRRLLVKDVA